MKLIKSLILGSAAGLVAMSGAQAADLPVKAKAVEYVRICSLYGAGFWYIPGTDTCIKIGGSIRIDTTFNGGQYDVPYWQGSANASQAFGKNWYATRSRFNLTEDTRTATEYGVLRTYANVQMDWTGTGGSSIAGGAPVEVDYAFVQFAGFTIGKAVSEFDPQWALNKPTYSGLNAGSNDATGINHLAYTATFGNGVSGTISLEDGQPYRTAGLVNTSVNFIAPFQANTLPAGAYGVGSFAGNAVAGDHVPDVVGNLRLDQAWGSLHFGVAAHEVHGTYYGADSTTGHPGSTYGFAVSGAFELKNLPTGAGDSFKAEASYGKGAAKYTWGGTLDTSGAGRFARTSGTQGGNAAFGYVLDGVYSGTSAANGTSISLSNSWEVSAFYEHYWNPAWRTSLVGNYSSISYGSTADAALLANLTGPLPVGVVLRGPGGVAGTVPTGSFRYDNAQVGTRTVWTPVKDLSIGAEFLYSRMIQHLNGTMVFTAANSGIAAGQVFNLSDQNLYNVNVNLTRSF
jgi:Porin subfamily